MDDKTFKKQIYKYLDKELQVDEAKKFEEYLESDPIAKMEFDKEAKFDQILRNHVVKEEAPYELRESIINQLEEKSSKPSFLAAPWLKPVLSSVLSLVIIFIFVVVITSNRNQFPAFAQAVESHVDYLHGGLPEEIKTSDVDEAVAWFNGKLDFAVTRPHISSKMATLVGARIIQINGQKAAYFMYEAEGKKISAFVLNLSDQKMEAINDYLIKDQLEMSVYSHTIKGFITVLCYHKSVQNGCMFVTDMSQEEFVSLMG